MRILVSGSTGQVGSELVRWLAPYGTVIAATRNTLDLSQPGELPARLSKLRPDMIVNPAAYTTVDKAEEEAELAYTVNSVSPRIISGWAADYKIPVIHFSTDYVFDGSGMRPWQEDDPTRPLNVYGASKAAGDRAVLNSGGSHLIVRTSWVYSASGRNFLRAIASAAAEREELRIVADQIGAPTSASWIAEVVSTIVAHELGDLSGGFERAGHCVNVAAAGETTWHGFALAIIDGLKKRDVPIKTRTLVAIRSEEYPQKAARPMNSRLDLSRLIDHMKIVPMSWETLLERELNLLVSPRDN